jgi:MFS family permease
VVAIPLLGRLGDLFGKRRLVLVALGAFAVGSLMCALADSIGLVIAGRIVQGFGAAVGPLTYGLARDTVAPELLPRAIGAVVGASAAGSAIGFVLSGILVDHASVPAIFWFLFALPIVLGAGVLALVQESPVRARSRVDAAGAVLLGLGLATLLLAISKGNAWGWSSGRVLGLFAASLASLTAFVLVERSVREPLVDLALVVTRPFANANVCAFTLGYAFFIAPFLVPQIAAAPTESGYGLGLSITETGLLLLPISFGALAGGWAGGRFVDRVGSRAIVAAGAAVGVVAYLALVFAHDAVLPIALANALDGLAIGLMLTGIAAVVVRSAGVDKTAIAAAVNSVTRTVANALGVQIAATIVTAAGLAGAFADESGFVWAFAMGAAGAGVALLASALMPRRAA